MYLYNNLQRESVCICKVHSILFFFFHQPFTKPMHGKLRFGEKVMNILQSFIKTVQLVKFSILLQNGDHLQFSFRYLELGNEKTQLHKHYESRFA